MDATTAAGDVGEILADHGDRGAVDALLAEARRLFRSVRHLVGAALATPCSPTWRFATRPTYDGIIEGEDSRV